LVAEGAAVHLVGIDVSRLEAAAELGCSSAVADVTDEAAVRAATG
jgi:NADP-dependent 3-hydroxy acid dehydrogenase YdfG